jgi:PAS domain S-box-containing protein
MLAINQPYTLLLAFAAILTASLAVYALKHHPNLGARSFSGALAAVSLWAFVSLFEVCSLDPNTKIFSYQIKYLFIVMVPPSWLTFGLYYSNRLQRLKRVHLVMLSVVPVITLLLVATNHYHQLMFTRFEIIDIKNYRLLYPYFGPLFWVHTAYSYSILAVGFVLFAKHLIDSPTHFHRQLPHLAIGGLAPWISNILFILKVGSLTYFDLTPVAFCISGVAFMWGVMRYRLLDIVPIARDVVIHNMRDGVIVVNNQDLIIDLNRTARQLSGIKDNNIIGVCAERIIPWWRSMIQRRNWDQMTVPPIMDVCIEGQNRMIQVSRSSLFNNGKTLGFMITLHDVTANQQVEIALRESEERFKSLSENAPVIIFSLDVNGALNYVNPAWESLLGYSRQEALGRLLVDFIPEIQIQSMAHTFEQLIMGQTSVAEINLHLVHKDGTQRLFNTSASANSNAVGRVTGIIGLAKDITGEDQLQQQLFQSQKMEAIGTLAGGIAHDFNNLLMGMQANLSLMRLEAGQSQSITEKVQRVEDQIQIGASLTRQLLGYARKGKYTVTVFDLNVLIKGTLNVIVRTNKKIVVKQRLSEQPIFIRADQGQMELALLNIVLNAVDAMPNGGELRVTSRLEYAHFSKDSVNKVPKRRQNVKVEITDTGVGMDKPTLNRIFEPFFTTKKMGQGTGLGLASVYGVIQNHSGYIEVQSELNQGSTFTLTLPAAAEPENRYPVTQDPIALPEGSAKILLVDDEPLILKYCHEMIVSLGFSVISTQKADEALKIYKNLWKEIDLVILDMVMPIMDGMQLFAALQKINPHVQAILATGYAIDDRISNLISTGRHDYLKKPYNRNDLAKTIGGLLGYKSQMPESGEIRIN